MGAVYDFATREQRPAPPDPTIGPSSDAETTGMTEAELEAFWRGVAWSAKHLYSPTAVVDLESAAEGERLFRDRRAAKRSRLEVV